MHMHSVSTTSGLNNWYAFSFFHFIVTGWVVLAALHKLQVLHLATLLEWQFPILPMKVLSLSPASPVRCDVYSYIVVI